MQFDRVVFHHAYFQSRGTTDNVFGFGSILHARQLYDNAVKAGLLDNRFGYAQFVHTVVQRIDVLFNRIRTYFIDCLFRQSQHDIVAVRQQRGFREQFLQLRQGFLYIGSILQRHGQTVFSLMHRAGTDFFAAQFAADVAGITFKRFLHRGFHVHLHGEMHAAAQVQTQEHRIGFDFRHPLRTVCQKVERGNITFAQSIFDDVARFQLRFGIFETHFQRVVDDEHTISLNTCLFQRGIHFRLGLIVDHDGLSVGRYLYGRRFTEKVGQRVNSRNHNRERNQQVFP